MAQDKPQVRLKEEAEQAVRRVQSAVADSDGFDLSSSEIASTLVVLGEKAWLAQRKKVSR